MITQTPESDVWPMPGGRRDGDAGGVCTLKQHPVWPMPGRRRDGDASRPVFSASVRPADAPDEEGTETSDLPGDPLGEASGRCPDEEGTETLRSA